MPIPHKRMERKMHSYLHELLADQTDGVVFHCFGPWHFFWIALTAAVFAALYLHLRSRKEQEKTLGALIDLCFGVYVLDFFLMPLAYGEIDIEKLPFHACTAMCVMCFLSRRSRFLGRFRGSFALLGFVSNLVYLIYPAGVTSALKLGVEEDFHHLLRKTGAHNTTAQAEDIGIVMQAGKLCTEIIRTAGCSDSLYLIGCH